jgi:hypothetical protein
MTVPEAEVAEVADALDPGLARGDHALLHVGAPVVGVEGNDGGRRCVGVVREAHRQ